MRSALVCLVAVLLLLAAGEPAQAAGRWRAARAARRAAQEQAHEKQVPAGVVPHRPALDPREIYPQYQGGFHSRALQNIGIPTGDIGIRGNGMTINPW